VADWTTISALATGGGTLVLAVSLRNVGPGIAVLHGGRVFPERQRARGDHAPLDEFSLLTRDIYIPPGKIGFWQIAFRDESPEREEMLAAVDRGVFSVQVLY